MWLSSGCSLSGSDFSAGMLPVDAHYRITYLSILNIVVVVGMERVNSLGFFVRV